MVSRPRRPLRARPFLVSDTAMKERRLPGPSFLCALVGVAWLLLPAGLFAQPAASGDHRRESPPRAAAAAAASRSDQAPRPQPPAPSWSPQDLARAWDAEHVSPPLPPLLRHADVEARLADLRRAAPDLFSLEEAGRSVEGRSIEHVWFGTGPLGVLLWSQMHGDEPTATAALFDVFDYVRRHRADPAVRRLLSALTVHVVPMLNPDGAERFQRRNAQGLDINRDALRLQTPEGRALKALRDRLNPAIGFNLHNQNWQTSAGRTGKPASISLLAVAFDEARSDNPGRVRAKKTCAVIRDALEPLAPGQVARYDDEFEVRAFGDNLTKWGTSVVLIETGPFSVTDPDPALVRLNFVALVSALDALATGRVDAADPARYESLPMNRDMQLYQVIRNASVVNGAGVPPFIADVGIAATRSVRTPAGRRRELHLVRRIDDLGDLRVLAGLEDIDATGLVVAPLFDASVRPGDEVRLPAWPLAAAGTAAPAGPPAAGPDRPGPRVAAGEPANLLLLRPLPGGAYRVERVIRGDEVVDGRESMVDGR
jgi:hypothetical protein